MDEPLDISVNFPGCGVECGVCVETRPTQGHFLVLDSVAFVEDVNFGDTIELRHIADDKYEFVRLVESAQYRVFDSILNKETVESTAMRTVFDRVDSLGGYWENFFGGCVYIALPSDTDYNPWEHLTSLAEQ